MLRPTHLRSQLRSPNNRAPLLAALLALTACFSSPSLAQSNPADPALVRLVPVASSPQTSLDLVSWGGYTLNDGFKFELNRPPTPTDSLNFGQVISTVPVRQNGQDAPVSVTDTATTGKVLAVAAGEFHTLLLRDDGSITASGWNPNGQTDVPADLPTAIAVAAGADHSLALLADGTVRGWGRNDFGQASPPKDLSDVIAIAGGGFHSLALKRDGSVVAWGSNSNNQLSLPPNLKNVSAIAAGGFHNLALLTSGQIIAWGDNSAGQCDVPPNLGPVAEISAGAYFSLVRLANGTVAAWGDNRSGESTVPDGLADVVDIAAGEFHSVALRKDGTAISWGDNSFLTATIPDGLTNVVAISAGGFHSVALVQNQPPMVLRRSPKGDLQLDLNLPLGKPFTIHAAKNLDAWRPIVSDIAQPGRTSWVVDAPALASACFFRIEVADPSSTPSSSPNK